MSDEQERKRFEAALPPLPPVRPWKPLPMYCGCGAEVHTATTGNVMAPAIRCPNCFGLGPFTTKLTTASTLPVPTYSTEQMREYAFAAWQAAIRSMIDRGSAGGVLQGAKA